MLKRITADKGQRVFASANRVTSKLGMHVVFTFHLHRRLVHNPSASLSLPSACFALIISVGVDRIRILHAVLSQVLLQFSWKLTPTTAWPLTPDSFLFVFLSKPRCRRSHRYLLPFHDAKFVT